MKKYYGIIIVCFLLPGSVFSQADTTLKIKYQSAFEKITQAVKEYKIDTSTVPDDRITKKIIELRQLKGGFNIDEAIEFKLEEDRQKNDISKEEFDKLSDFFKTGNGKKLLDNAVTWIYRKHFTYKELKQAVKFYKTPGGKKMATDFPIVMMQSFAAAQMIKDMYGNKK